MFPIIAQYAASAEGGAVWREPFLYTSHVCKTAMPAQPERTVYVDVRFMFPFKSLVFYKRLLFSDIWETFIVTY